MSDASYQVSSKSSHRFLDSTFLKYLYHIWVWQPSWYRNNYIQNFVEKGPAVSEESKFEFLYINQRTNGPVNAHLISWPSKAQNIHNLENKW